MRQPMEEKANQLQTQLGRGQFFSVDNKKHFLLAGINLAEENGCLGKIIQRKLN
jgi:hypothetical protein